MIAGIDTANFWLQFVAGVVVVGGGVWGFIEIGIRIIKRRENIVERLDRIEAQYRNNGGSSMRDSVDRIERSISDLRLEVTRLDRAIERHMGLHEGLDL